MLTPKQSRKLREEVLEEAKSAVTVDRNRDYSEPENNFENIARLWTAYIPDYQFTRKDVAVMFMLTKIARSYATPTLKDHWVDIAGYAACAQPCAVVDSEEPLGK